MNCLSCRETVNVTISAGPEAAPGSYSPVGKCPRCHGTQLAGLGTAGKHSGAVPAGPCPRCGTNLHFDPTGTVG